MSAPLTPAGPGRTETSLPAQPASKGKESESVKPKVANMTSSLPATVRKPLHERLIEPADTTTSLKTPAFDKADEKTSGVREKTGDVEQKEAQGRPLKKSNNEVIKKAEYLYERKLDEYRTARGQEWLRDNFESVIDSIDHPKKNSKLPFKLFVMINGEKQLIVPMQNKLSKSQRKQAISYVKTQLGSVVKSLPEKEDLAKKTESCETFLKRTYSSLVNLGRAPKVSLEEEVFSMGLRIDCMRGKQPKVSSYYPDVEDVVKTKSRHDKNQLEFGGFGLLADPPEPESDFMS